MATAARPGFNHNDFYHRFLLRRVPPSCARALDIGCGTGLLTRRLARRAQLVEGIDQDPEAIDAARALASRTPTIDYIEADLTTYDLNNRRYDYISCLASIHHMPFAETVIRLREALAPGGVLTIVGCYRQTTSADYLPDLVAIPANYAANAAIHAIARYNSRVVPQVDTAPTMQPQMTLAEVKREANDLLPGAAIHRRIFWRYSLTYRRPGTAVQ
jgi:SAM-dependent methyltransferase